MGLLAVAGEEEGARVVLEFQREGLGQPSAGVRLAPQQLVAGLAHPLAAEVHLEHRGHVASPGAGDRRAVVQHHHRVGLGGRHCGDQLVLAVGQVHVPAVVPLGLKAVRQPGKDHRGLGLFGGRHRRGDAVPLKGVLGRREAGHVGHGAALALRGLERAGHPAGVDVARTAALIAGRGRVAADVGDLLARLEGQDAVVLQQHRALGGHRHRPGMVGGAVKLRVGLAVVDIAEQHREQPLDRLVQHRLVEGIGLDRLDDLLVGVPARGRHLEIQPGREALDPVGHRAPVGHDIALKAPVLPQHLVQQPVVLGGVDPVDLVVAAHHRLGLGGLDRLLKAGQVDLPQRPLGQLGGDAHPVILLVIGGKVLDAGAHPLALHPADVGGGQLAGEVGVLRDVLKVAAAERAALDVDRRAQQNAHVLGLALLPEGLAQAGHELGVEAGRGGAGGGEADRLHAVIDPQMIPLGHLLAQAVRAVGHHHRGHPQPLHRLGVPEIQPGA